MKNIYIKLLFSYLFVLMIALVLTYISFFLIMKKETEKEISDNLKIITNSLEISVVNILDKSNEEIQNEIIKYGKKLNLRITLIDYNGKVFADSNYDPEKMENHKLREEVQSALMGKPEVFKRYSNTLKEYMYYYAVLINLNEDKQIILRVSSFTKLFSRIYKDLFQYLLIIFISVFLIGLFISYLFSSNMSNNFHNIYNFLKNLSSGEFKERIFLKKPEEFKELSNYLNKTAERLEELFIKEKSEKEEVSAIIENIKDPIGIINKKGIITYANSPFLNLFFKETFSDLYYFEIINNLKVIEMLDEHIKDKKDRAEEVKIGDKTFFVNIKNLPEISETLIIMNDITFYKEIIRIKKELVANLSHEIKTPITIIYGYLEILEENLKGNELEILKKLQEQVKNLLILTEEMLNLSIIEEGKIVENFEEVNLIEVLKKSVEVYKIPFEKKGLFLKLEIPEETIKIMGSKKLLERLFLNLLDNGLKFTEKGGVLISLKQNENNFIFEFQDTGTGIKEEDLPFIFERFYVSEKGRQKEKSGFGLGLSIVKHIVDLHKGRIEVRSQIRKGTSFILYFPF